MPRHKYAKVNRLDKLHRQQKEAMKQEKLDSQNRALLLEQSMKSGEEPLPSAADLPFHIGRTKSRNLPIYESVKGGGSKHITEIRKLTGDLQEMQKQLCTVLQLPKSVIDGKGRKKEPVSINHLTNNILISGWRGPEVKKWAETLGF